MPIKHGVYTLNQEKADRDNRTDRTERRLKYVETQSQREIESTYHLNTCGDYNDWTIKALMEYVELQEKLYDIETEACRRAKAALALKQE